MEANGGFIYKMAANPCSDSPDTRFFLQAYEQAESGKLFPRDVLYIGTQEQCRAFLSRLSAGELTQEQVKNFYIHGEEPKIRYYHINEAAAEQAHRLNSMYAFIRPEGGGSISALQPYNHKQRETPDRGDR